MSINLEVSNNYISQISLLNYRNFSGLKICPKPLVNVLYGGNGLGKTNLIEAISLFAPGRGLRNAKPEYLLSNFDSKLIDLGWSVKVNVTNNANRDTELITYYNAASKKRVISVNGKKLAKQAEISDFLKFVWLTPDYDNIFNDSAQIRRKFLDRIVNNFFPDHNQNLHKYDYYLRERLNILRQHYESEAWLKQVENSIAELSVAIIYSRLTVISYLNEALANLDKSYPQIKLDLEGGFKDFFLSKEEKEREIEIAKFFANNRSTDRNLNQTSAGVHKLDFTACYLPNNLSAKFCSTGEQKTIIFAIILAYIYALNKICNFPPIILLDEVVSHLDQDNIKKIFNEIVNLNAQIFVTTTNKNNVNYPVDVNYIDLAKLMNNS